MSGDEAIRMLKARHSGKIGINRTATLPRENASAASRSGLRQTSLAQAGQRALGTGMGIPEDARSQASMTGNAPNATVTVEHALNRSRTLRNQDAVH